jgi:polysaccharide deacetylase 2 family uncharacterized protein YibQ
MNRRSGFGPFWIPFVLLLGGEAWSDGAAVGVDAPQTVPRIALIIDDLGHVLTNGSRAAALDGPVACAILPLTPYAARIASRAHAAGKEVMLHLPLQSIREAPAMSVGTIQIDTTRGELARILEHYLELVPYVVGINNHQGSALTRHPGHMTWLMEEMRRHGDLFFVDSYTTESSIALRVARERGVPSIRRDVFLDNTPTREAIASAFRRLKQRALAHGVAVGIGHPYVETLEFLEQAIPALRAEGFELVPVSRAISLDRAPSSVKTASLEP